jgi:hypothetical protein
MIAMLLAFSVCTEYCAITPQAPVSPPLNWNDSDEVFSGPANATPPMYGLPAWTNSGTDALVARSAPPMIATGLCCSTWVAQLLAWAGVPSVEQ